MPELLTTAQRELAARASAFAHEHLLGKPAGAQARAEVIAASKDAGLFTMTQPRSHGGTEAGAIELTVVRDELAALNPPHLHAVFGPGPGVLAGCTGPLATRYLEPMLAGIKRGAFGFTEPESHPTVGVLRSDRVVINGRKSYVTGGLDADFINVVLNIEGHGPAIVVVDTDAPGVRILERFASLDGSQHAAFEFVDVEVAGEHIVGKPGEGMPRALRQIGDTRLLIAAQCVGLMRWVIDHVTVHLGKPDRGGGRRGDREGVRLRYADLRIDAFAARSMLYRTARLVDSGANAINESIACKVFATEAVARVVDSAIQLVGGEALVVGHPLETLYRQVRAWRLAEGASDVIRLGLARGKLELDKGII
jgi:alkylation response protein AidB-like acyl-CoA dehydrogenase